MRFYRVNPVEYSDLENPTPAESSADIKKRVDKARKLQLERFCGEGIYSNSQMQTKHIRKYCMLGDEENALLKRSFEKLGLSARAYDRILKVARTIADLDGCEDIVNNDMLGDKVITALCHLGKKSCLVVTALLDNLVKNGIAYLLVYADFIELGF